MTLHWARKELWKHKRKKGSRSEPLSGQSTNVSVLLSEEKQELELCSCSSEPAESVLSWAWCELKASWPIDPS